MKKLLCLGLDKTDDYYFFVMVKIFNEKKKGLPKLSTIPRDKIM